MAFQDPGIYESRNGEATGHDFPCVFVLGEAKAVELDPGGCYGKRATLALSWGWGAL